MVTAPIVWRKNVSSRGIIRTEIALDSKVKRIKSESRKKSGGAKEIFQSFLRGPARKDLFGNDQKRRATKGYVWIPPPRVRKGYLVLQLSELVTSDKL